MYVKPKEACKYYGVSDQALRLCANEGKVKYITTKGGHRRYILDQPKKSNINPKQVLYARVSSSKQKDDLKRQCDFLREKYPNHDLVTDIGSGINFKRKGFKTILEGVFTGTIKTVVVAQRDRFTRFGFELFEWIFEKHGATLLYSETESPKPTPSQELSEDLLAIITVFSSRYYGRRKYKTDNLL